MTSNHRTRNNGRPAVSASGGTATSARERAQARGEAKKRKEQFLIFIKALMRDLSQMDPAMHARAKRIIQECTEKKKKRVPGFDFERTMRTRLLDAVGESNWRRVERELHRRSHAQKEQVSTTMTKAKKQEHRRVGSTDTTESSKEKKQGHRRVASTGTTESSNSSTSFSLTSDEEQQQPQPHQPSPREEVDLDSNVSLSLNDVSVELELIHQSMLEKEERQETEAKMAEQPALVQKAQSRPPAAVVVPEEPRYIYI